MRLRRWLKRILLGVIGLGIIVVLASVWRVRRAWTPTTGELQIPGLGEPVNIIRDEWGVPHIYAENEHDLVFAQGFVHAQDRMWQMEVNRRYGSGTLSEIIGSIGIDSDRFVRTLGLRRAAEQSLRTLDSETVSFLQSYADGVNAYITMYPNRLAVEFALLNVTPDPWQPVDTLLYGNVLAMSLSRNYYEEVVQGSIVGRIGAEAAADLFPVAGRDTPTIVVDAVDEYEWLTTVDFDTLNSAFGQLGHPRLPWASNSWVVAGSLTASGEPLLANDTHLSMMMPSVWYENGLHGGRFDSVGFAFPGVPFNLIGRNTDIAWGITNMGPDNQDLYMERLDDEDEPTEYQYDEQWYPIEHIEETIPVRFGDDEAIDIYATRHGPLVDDIIGLTSDQPLSLRWSVYDDDASFMRSIVRLNEAADWDQFQAALDDWDTLGLNFIYADMDGNIGYRGAGTVPIRQAGHQGIVPVPGWTSEYEWQGIIPAAEMPSLYNPSEGFIVTANNKITADDYPHQLAYDWYIPGYRAQTITDLLLAKDELTSADMQRIQRDTYAAPAEALRPYLLNLEPQNEREAEALRIVADWDLRYETDSVGATIFEVWYLEMVSNTVDDELGDDLSDEYEELPPRHMPMLIGLIDQPDNVWFDDVKSAEIETRDDMIRLSLVDALGWLEERAGSDMSAWQWGDLHTLTLVHLPLGVSGIPPLEVLFNSEDFAAPGGIFTVDRGDYFDRFEVIFATSQRFIIDFAQPDSLLMVNSSGQSEHVFHQYREDQIQLWRDGTYQAIEFSNDAAIDAQGDTMWFRPKPTR